MDILFSKIIKAGRTTYFVDVKEAKNKSRYITIAESSPSGENKYNRHRIIIFDRAIDAVRDALIEASDLVNQDKEA